MRCVPAWTIFNPKYLFWSGYSLNVQKTARILSIYLIIDITRARYVRFELLHPNDILWRTENWYTGRISFEKGWKVLIIKILYRSRLPRPKAKVISPGRCWTLPVIIDICCLLLQSSKRWKQPCRHVCLHFSQASWSVFWLFISLIDILNRTILWKTSFF